MNNNSRYSRVIIHQFDPLVQISGGIDTCIRGLLKFKPISEEILIIGVDSQDKKGSSRELGVIQHFDLEGNHFDFIPVAKLNAGNQQRIIPHTIRVYLGVLKYARKFLNHTIIQVHRTDIFFLISLISKSRIVQFIHTQKGGLASENSDSKWKRFRRLYELIDTYSIKRASQVVVFNESYANQLSSLHSHVHFSPTWHDFPDIKLGELPEKDGHQILWIGRFEDPKAPMFALEIICDLLIKDPRSPWRLIMVGEGTLYSQLASFCKERGIDTRVRFSGYQNKSEIQSLLLSSEFLLFTSFPGYEGFPRVVLEALSQGLPVVAVAGSESGQLIFDGVNGFCVPREVENISTLISNFPDFDSSQVKETVSGYTAQKIVAQIFSRQV